LTDQIDLFTFAQDLASELGYDGKAIRGAHDGYASIDLGDAVLSLYREKGKVQVGIEAKVDRTDRNFYASEHKTAKANITPDLARIARIAVDIRKRVIDPSQSALQAQRDWEASRKTARASSASTADKLDAMGLYVKRDQTEPRGDFSTRGNSHHISGYFNGDSVNIRSIGSISVEKFAQIVAILNQNSN
jgi:hypothetical protein